LETQVGTHPEDENTRRQPTIGLETRLPAVIAPNDRRAFPDTRERAFIGQTRDVREWASGQLHGLLSPVPDASCASSTAQAIRS
jgi:hypothetical protein